MNDGMNSGANSSWSRARRLHRSALCYPERYDVKRVPCMHVGPTMTPLSREQEKSLGVDSLLRSRVVDELACQVTHTNTRRRGSLRSEATNAPSVQETNKVYSLLQ